MKPELPSRIRPSSLLQELTFLRREIKKIAKVAMNINQWPLEPEGGYTW